jgi:hypothetical protein
VKDGPIAQCGPPYPPINLYEYQKKGLTKFAFRKLFILNGAIKVV